VLISYFFEFRSYLSFENGDALYPCRSLSPRYSTRRNTRVIFAQSPEAFTVPIYNLRRRDDRLRESTVNGAKLLSRVCRSRTGNFCYRQRKRVSPVENKTLTTEKHARRAITAGVSSTRNDRVRHDGSQVPTVPTRRPCESLRPSPRNEYSPSVFVKTKFIAR